MIISLTGKPCSGKSSIAKILRDKYNFKVYSVGEMFKDEAHKRDMTAEEFNKFLMSDPKFDNFIDEKTVELGKLWKYDDVVFDSRLAWHFIPHSFKVFVDLDNEELARRLVNSDRVGKEKYENEKDAFKTIIGRFNAENKRYKKFYGVDNTDMKNYNLVISSKNKTPEELADFIYLKYKEYFNLK